MPQPPEIIETEQSTVACDGAGGGLGHPRVFLTMDSHGRVECPYCGRRFKRTGAKAGSAH